MGTSIDKVSQGLCADGAETLREVCGKAEVMAVTDQLFILLQINDAAFPIGAYAHSYGLETYIQEGLVKTAQDAADYLEQNLKASFLYSELLAAKLAHEAASRREVDELARLEEALFASKVPCEIRQASQKLGVRFVKTAGLLLVSDTVFSEYIASHKDAKTSHAVAYGVFTSAAGLRAADSLAAFLYAQAAAMVTCCVKTIPLSQTDGQRMLSGARRFFPQILEALEGLGRDDLCRSCPGLEIRAMRHENLYSRLYMS
ncbi:MAG: urease accessory protein UreF [Oscillospiraceae bacterium]|nr:urease accessory protein UreF [Oscillospiraceae bacterium]